MKKILFLICAVLSLSLNAQSIKKNEIDEFTGARRIETSWEKVVWQQKPLLTAYARIRVINGEFILDMKFIRDGSLVVTKKDPIIFLDAKKEKHELYPKETFTGGRGKGAVNIMGDSSWGIYIHYFGDLSFLETSTPVKLRWYTTDGYVNGTIRKKYMDRLPELYKLAKEASAKKD